MVNNSDKILDAGEYKYIAHNKMPKKVDPWKLAKDYKQLYLDSLDLKPEHRLKPMPMDDTLDEFLYDFFNVKPFGTCWMLNVSPNWKGKEINPTMVAHFVATIEAFYENCSRFTKYSYVLENGHDEDHLHAHIVFQLNPEKMAGTMTSIRKSKILNEFRNCWNRIAKDAKHENYVHLLPKGNNGSLQTCLINNEIMLKDKLDYLVEDLKPFSHQNDPHPLCPIKGGNWN